jgi:hypothetical protein
LLAFRIWYSDKDYIENALGFLKPLVSLVLLVLVIVVFLTLALG